MSKPICLGFELTKAVSLHRVKKTQIFSHHNNTHSALLLLQVSHTWSTLPLSTSPSCRMHRRYTVEEVFDAIASSSSLTNHHRCSISAFVPPAQSRGRCTITAPSRSRCIFFFEQPSPTSTIPFHSVCLHRRCTAPSRRLFQCRCRWHCLCLIMFLCMFIFTFWVVFGFALI